MRIKAKIKNTGKHLFFDDSNTLEEMFIYCPSFIKLFPDKNKN